MRCSLYGRCVVSEPVGTIVGLNIGLNGLFPRQFESASMLCEPSECIVGQRLKFRLTASPKPLLTKGRALINVNFCDLLVGLDVVVVERLNAYECSAWVLFGFNSEP